VNDELTQLCQSAEELLLSGLAKEAGFNLSVIFDLLKGLASERAAVTYLIAHPNQVQNVKNWDEAISKARTS
jgi:Cys-tRNA synthase (O-phospho-L-seryl-tRNA:Cys-tRNA synthase)